MIISLNTDTLNELAALAMQINTELAEAYAAVSPVTEHDDWNCAERDDVNEAILRLKVCFTQLKDCAAEFSSAVRHASVSFTELEQTHSQSLQGLHSVIADALSLHTPVSTPGGIHFWQLAHPWNAFNDGNPVPFPLSQSYYPYIVKNFDKPLSVVDFGQISLNQ